MRIIFEKYAVLMVTIASLAVAFFMIFFEIGLEKRVIGEYLEGGSLSDTQQKSLDIILDLRTLLMNWSIAIIGVTGFFLKLNFESDIKVSKIEVITAYGIIFIAILSSFFGHLAIEQTAIVLSLDQFPLNNQNVRRLGALQYLSGLTALTLFGIFVFQFFWFRVKKKTEYRDE